MSARYGLSWEELSVPLPGTRPGATEVQLLTAPRGVAGALSADPLAMVALSGPSGIGKSSWLRAWVGTHPLRGRLWVARAGERREISGREPADRRVGWVQQGAALLPHLNLGENLRLGARLRGLDPSRTARAVAQWCAALGLGDLEGSRSVTTLSGGEAQRAAWVRALVSEPDWMAVDEPWSALDATHTEQLLKAVLPELRKAQISIVIVSHDTERLTRLIAAEREHAHAVHLQFVQDPVRGIRRLTEAPAPH